jgi:hypothetical protein
MSFLEERLRLIQESYIDPAKDGSDKAMEGKKFNENLHTTLHTIPKFHHSFSLWTNFIDWNFSNIVSNTVHTCYNLCHDQKYRTAGKNVRLSTSMIEECKSQCMGDWGSPVKISLDVYIKYLYFHIFKN